MNLLKILSALCILLMVSCASENSTKENVTDGGIKYQIIKNGSGDVAKDGDYVFFHVNYLADDKEMFNSRDAGKESSAKIDEASKRDLVTTALQYCLKKAAKGDSIEFYVPTDSLRNMGFPETDETKMLTYRMKVTDILSEADYQAKMAEERAAEAAKIAEAQKRLPEVEKFVQDTYKYIASGKAGDNIKELPSGLKYIIHEEGEGDLIKPGEKASVNYYGILKSNGNMFDNSWKRGTPFQFTVGQGQVIRGWDEGLTLFKKGTRGTLIIPYAMAYGEAGRPPSIPEKSDLIFYIEVPK